MSVTRLRVSLLCDGKAKKPGCGMAAAPGFHFTTVLEHLIMWFLCVISDAFCICVLINVVVQEH